MEDSPDGGTAIALGRIGTERIAGLEGESFLDAVDGGEVVVFDLAEF